MTARGPTLRAAVQTGRDLLTWTTQPSLELRGYSEGQCEILGDAEIVLHWGAIAHDAGLGGRISEPDLAAGTLVRILQEDADGNIEIDDVAYQPVWCGKLLGPEADSTGTNGTTTYRCAGIAALLHECVCRYGRTRRPAGVPLISFAVDQFNAGEVCDRSAERVWVGGEEVYIHDTTDSIANNRWTARQILEYLIACNSLWENPPTHNGIGQTGIRWALDDPDGCLEYVPPRYDAAGKSLFRVLQDLAGTRRGLAWRAYTFGLGGQAYIGIFSARDEAITVGSTTIPRNAAVWDLDATDDPFISDLRVREHADEVADEIVVQGSPRTFGISLLIKGSGSPFVADSTAGLVPGWSAAQEAACNAFLDSEIAPIGTRRAIYEPAWSRFKLSPTWNGDTFGGGAGMPDGLVTGSDAYGNGGLTGETVRLGIIALPGSSYRAEGDLPCAFGFSSSLDYAQRQGPVIVVEESADVWVDRSQSWGIRVEPSPPAVVITDGANGKRLRETLLSGLRIVVTLSIRDAFPFQASWIRTPTTWPSVSPRVTVVEVHDLTASTVLAGAVTGVSDDGGGTLTTLAMPIVVRDDIERLRAALAHARSFYEQPYTTASWTNLGAWECNDGHGPGSILGTVTDAGIVRHCQALVTRRSVRLGYAVADDGQSVPYWSTSYETDVVYPDLEAVL